MYALVKDRTADAQGLPLRKAVIQLAQRLTIPDASIVVVTMAAGHGQRVNELDDGTESFGVASVTLGELLALLASGDEWFDELRATIDGEVAFGVIDSSAIVIEGEQEIVTDSVRGFRHVSFHQGRLLLAR